MVNAPFTWPLKVGVNVTEKLHFAFAASVPVHGLVLLPTAEKSPLVE